MNEWARKNSSKINADEYWVQTGLVTSTALTLVVLPALYRLFTPNPPS